MKKIILGLGGIAAVASPLAVLSCSSAADNKATMLIQQRVKAKWKLIHIDVETKRVDYTVPVRVGKVTTMQHRVRYDYYALLTWRLPSGLLKKEKPEVSGKNCSVVKYLRSLLQREGV